MKKMETKSKLKQKCSKLLRKNLLTIEDKEFLHYILKKHPEYNKKIGAGLKDFFVKVTPYNTLGFCILRVDGTSTDFSFYKCITKPSKKAEIKSACRKAIESSIEEVKTTPGLIIHHSEISFNEIVEQWLEENVNIDLRINDTEDNSYYTLFKNKETSKSFKKYHDARATLIEITLDKHKLEHAARQKL